MAAQVSASLAMSCSCAVVRPELSSQTRARREASNSTGKVIKEKIVVAANKTIPNISRYGNMVMVSMLAKSIHCIHLEAKLTAGVSALRIPNQR